jgi:hypothetical protein
VPLPTPDGPDNTNNKPLFMVFLNSFIMFVVFGG